MKKNCAIKGFADKWPTADKKRLTNYSINQNSSLFFAGLPRREYLLVMTLAP